MPSSLRGGERKNLQLPANFAGYGTTFIFILFVPTTANSVRYLLQGIDRTDDDYQMDDAMLTRAANKQSQSYIDSRDRQIAIFGQRLLYIA